MKTKFEFIIYVSDQQKSCDFYKIILGKEPQLNVPGMTEFVISDECKLGIMPEKNIAKIISPAVKDPSLFSGVSRCEIYLYVENPDKKLEGAIKAGAKLVSNCEDRDWGDRAGYCADADGHVIVFARRN